MKKSMLSVAAVVVLSVSSAAASAQSGVISQGMSGANPRPRISAANTQSQTLLETIVSVVSILVMYTF